MAELSAGLASTLHATTTWPLVPREPIGRRRLRRDRGILLFQRELALEIRDSEVVNDFETPTHRI